jgi:hypothetical protein
MSITNTVSLDAPPGDAHPMVPYKPAEDRELMNRFARLVLRTSRFHRGRGPQDCCRVCHDDALLTSDEEAALCACLDERAASLPVHEYHEFLDKLHTVLPDQLLRQELGLLPHVLTSDETVALAAWVQAHAVSAVCRHLRAKTAVLGREVLHYVSNAHVHQIVDMCSAEVAEIPFYDLLDLHYYVLLCKANGMRRAALSNCNLGNATPAR